MKPLPLGEMAALLEGKLCGPNSVRVTGFATDSRDVEAGDLFLAIKGEFADGHEFVVEALQKGASASVVERPVDGPHILVDSLVAALARFGRNLRRRFHGPVVGITGSTGKTTTKEFLSAALGARGPVLKSPGNRNTEYTSPLVWADATPDSWAAVIEMSMRGPGQIAHLCSVASPSCALITNVGYAHLMQLGSRENIARAKGELLEALPPDGFAVLWQACEFLPTLRRIAGKSSVYLFGDAEGADCRLVSCRRQIWSSMTVIGEIEGELWEAELPTSGRHMALDAAAAILTAKLLGVSLGDAAAGLARVRLPAMRMETRAFNGATVILDAYNASPPSMIAAIEELSESHVEGRRIAVIGEMRELGDLTEEAHRMVGDALARSSIDSVLFVGEATGPAHAALLGHGFSGKVRSAGSIRDVAEFLRHVRPGDAVLIKGSRALELEKALSEVERC